MNMKTITQLKDDLKALMKASADIDAKATLENRCLSESEKNLKNELLDKVEEIQKEIHVREREIRIADALEKPGDAMTVPRSEDVRPKNDKSKERFNSLGEQLGAIINAGKPNGAVDPRLYNAASGLNETVGSEGGFLVQQDLTEKLYEDLFGNGLIAGQCEKLPISH
jgi:HK97 family phage major capsid protein